MPLISQFYGILIYLYKEIGGHHNQPHIHIKYNEYEMSMTLDGKILSGDIPNKQKKIVRYKRDNIVTLKGNDDIYYCSKCWDDEEKLIQVLQKGPDFYECPKCKTRNYFYGKEPVIEEEQGEKNIVV